MKLITTLLTTATLLVSCGIPQNQADQDITNDRSDLTGSFEELQNGRVSYRAVEDEQGAIITDLDVNGKNFTVIMHQENGLQEINGNGVVLDEQDRKALQEAQDLLEAQIDPETIDPKQRALIAVTSYIAAAPEGYVHENRKFNSSLGLKDEGITCIKKGRTAKAEWNTQSSTYESLDIVVGTNYPNNYGCMGRCGADCGSWWIPSSWTKDCLDHDMCSYLNNASGGSSDPNCGDEYNEAADDWLGGVWVGCSG